MIRRARFKDLKECRKLCWENTAHFPKKLRVQFWKESLFYIIYLLGPKSVIWVYETESELRGMIVLSDTEFGHLIVSAKHRNNGLAKKLITYAEGYLKLQDEKVITAKTTSELVPFYANLGFKPTNSCITIEKRLI